MALRTPVRTAYFRGNRIVTEPAAEPNAASDLSTYLRLAGSETTLLETLITEARQEIEDLTGLAMINQSWKLTLDRWPGDREPWWDGMREAHINALAGLPGWVVLPRFPLSSVTSVTTYDQAGSSTAITVATVFDTDTAQVPGRLCLKSGQAWPVATRDTNAIEIVYVAGYGASAASVPAPLKAAVRDLAAWKYEHRGECDAYEALRKSGAMRAVQAYGARL